MSGRRAAELLIQSKPAWTLRNQPCHNEHPSPGNVKNFYNQSLLGKLEKHHEKISTQSGRCLRAGRHDAAGGRLVQGRPDIYRRLFQQRCRRWLRCYRLFQRGRAGQGEKGVQNQIHGRRLAFHQPGKSGQIHRQSGNVRAAIRRLLCLGGLPGVPRQRRPAAVDRPQWQAVSQL